MSRFFIGRPIVAMVISIVMVLLGLVSMGRLPVALFPDIAPPEIRVESTEASLSLDVRLEWPAFADGQVWRLGLAAVIEETDGNRSYWALAHPPGDPDFHHSDCFALALPIAESS